MSRLLVALVFLLILPGVARAEVIGAGAIEARWNRLSDKEEDRLGLAMGPAKAVTGGSRRLYEHGAIIYSESAGAVYVDPDMWPRYKALGAEQGELGFPVEDRGSRDYSQEFQRGTLAGLGSKQYIVRGVLLTMWKKNKREHGPLGLPLADGVLGELQGPPPYDFPITTSARQDFQGAEIDFRASRAAAGGPAWIVVEAHPFGARRVRVLASGHLGGPGVFCPFDIDETRWIHPGIRFTNWNPTDEKRCHGDDNYRMALVTLEVETAGQFLKADVRGWGWWRVDDDSRSAWALPTNTDPILVPHNEEENFWFNEHLDAPPYDEWLDDDMFLEKVTVRHFTLKAGDIQF